MIKKTRGKYVVISETTGRRMGTYQTLKAAKQRLRQIEFFKRLRTSPRLRGRLRKKSLARKFRK